MVTERLNISWCYILADFTYVIKFTPTALGDPRDLRYLTRERIAFMGGCTSKITWQSNCSYGQYTRVKDIWQTIKCITSVVRC